MQKSIRDFKSDIKDGLNFVCESCHRLFFKRSVKTLNIEETKELVTKNGRKFLESIMPEVDFSEEHPLIHLCHKCHFRIKSGMIPNFNSTHDLWVDEKYLKKTI